MRSVQSPPNQCVTQRASTSTMADRVHFSGVESLVFGKHVSFVDPPWGSLQSVGLFSHIFQGSRAKVMKAYTDFFFSTKKTIGIRIQDVPAPLAPIFMLLQYCKVNEHKLLSNGAGKYFLSHLLSLGPYVDIGHDWMVKMSTTSDPRSDWCGVVSLENPRISGVVDVLVETMNGTKLVVGEVKSAAGGDGEPQLIAELRMFQQLQPKNPILGVLITPAMIRLYIRLFGRKSEFCYSTISRDVQDLEAVLECLDVAFGFLSRPHSATLMPAHTPLNVQEQIAELQEQMSKMALQLEKLSLQVERLQES